MSLVEAGYGTFEQVEQMSPILRRSITYARAELKGARIDWDSGRITWPKQG